MNAKTNYTHKELTRRSTAQLIAIYNRLFNTNIWDEMFNPFEARQEILLALFAEMRAQEIVAQYTDEDLKVKKHKALEIVVSYEGIVLIWTADKPERPNNRKYSNDIIREVRQLYTEGVSQRQICRELGLKPSRVFRIIKGWVYADVSV